MVRPTTGLITADTRKPKEKAPAARPRSQPNSSTMGGNIREKAVRVVTLTATVRNAIAMITQPKKNGRRAANDAGRGGKEGDGTNTPLSVSPVALWQTGGRSLSIAPPRGQ